MPICTAEERIRSEVVKETELVHATAASAEHEIQSVFLLSELPFDLPDLFERVLTGGLELAPPLILPVLVALADGLIIVSDLLAVGGELLAGLVELTGAPLLRLVPLELVDLTRVELGTVFLVLGKHRLLVGCDH